ncbi:MAG: hypothetical protein H7X95_02160, partial [Deltaproteobacteria bacterium]|nr:hypothetical protein [Deltaproteobacteria bacterium]
MKPNTVTRAIQDQVEANRSGMGHAETFAGHRARLTQEIAARAPAGGKGRLCLLGAGNAFDVDLDALAARFNEIHLVDIDGAALEGARSRVLPGARGQLHLHAPVDISGSWDRLGEWVRRETQVDSWRAEVAPAAARVVAALPGPFDVVVSCCMLTQLQLALLQEIGDRHPAFESLRGLMNAVHVRVITGLLAPSGRGLLVTDLTTDETYPLDVVGPDADLQKLMADLVSVGNVIHAAHPGLLSAEIRRDPVLAAAFNVRFPVGPWLWHNGPERIFLVYGMEISSKAGEAQTRDKTDNKTTGEKMAKAPAMEPGSSEMPAGTPAAATAGTRLGGEPLGIVEMDNVIPKLYEDLIEAEANSLGWYFHAESARPNLGFAENYGGFYHMSYDGLADNPVGSAINAVLVPLLFIFCDKAKIPFNNLIRVRLGMFAKTPIDVEYHNPHVDFYVPHNVALYYVNDSDGDTVVFNETSDQIDLEQSARHANEKKFTQLKRISPKKGRMMAFDGRHYHASMHPM